MKSVKIVKIGGNIVDKPEALEQFLDDFQKLEGPKVLIHGGGAIASKLSKELGIEVKMHNGRRITDYETLKLVTMVYAGLINKQITAALQKRGCMAVGLSGADGNSVPATRRAANPIDWGYVGDVAYSLKPDTYKLMTRLSEQINVKMVYYTKTKTGLTIEVEE